MSAKALHPNQCDYLHPYFPPAECCLCKARKEIEVLKAEVKELQEAVNLLIKELQENDK